MGNTTVSVIVPMYNSEKTLSRAVDSVLRQTFANFELFLIDDGSTDSTLAIAEQYLDDPRVRVLTTDQPSGGPVAPRNLAIERASGEWLAFLDSDDEWHPTKLELQLEVAAMQDADLVYSRCEVVRADRVSTYPGRGFVNPQDLVPSLIESNFVPCLTVLVRTSWAQAVGGFDARERGAEDWDMWLRLALRGAKFAFAEEPLARHHIHGENRSGSVDWDGRLAQMFIRLALEHPSHRMALVRRSLRFVVRRGKGAARRRIRRSSRPSGRIYRRTVE